MMTKQFQALPVTCIVAIKKKRHYSPTPLSPLSIRSKPAAIPKCHLKPVCVEAAAAEQEYFRLCFIQRTTEKDQYS